MSLKYRVIERFKDVYPIGAMCEFFEVPRSSYYVWRKKQEQPAREADIVETMREVWNRSKQTYGYYRMWKYFREKLKKPVNIQKIRRIMRKYGMAWVIRRRRAYS